MLTSLEWQTLEQRRRISRLVMMYKTQQQLVDIDRDSYLRPGDSRTRGQHRFFQERFNYDTQKLLPKNITRMEPPTRHHSWGQLHRGVQG
jgi:Tfp pilus assembly PilM family ATPase